MLGLVLLLVRVLPASLGILLARLFLLSYLLLKPAYRVEIRANLRMLCGRDEPHFWIRNAWCVGRNLAFMSWLGSRRAHEVVDKAVVRGENGWRAALEQDLHVVMASFHYGVWEYLPKVFAKLTGKSVAIGVGRQRDAALGRVLLQLRGRGGVCVLHSSREVIARLSAPGVTGFMLDNTGAGTRTGVACDGFDFAVPNIAYRVSAARHTGVYPLFARLEHGRVVVEVYPEGDENVAVRALHQIVRDRPEEWIFWAKAGAIVPCDAEPA